jgi:hypothetical protein
MLSLLRHPIALGKLTGIAVGLAVFFALPAIIPDIESNVRWGFLFWYLTFGAIIGSWGVSPQPEFIPLRVPWWLRAPLIGAWMNFVLALFAYDVSFFTSSGLFVAPAGLFTSPAGFIVSGAIIGLLIGFVGTKWGRTG